MLSPMIPREATIAQWPPPMGPRMPHVTASASQTVETRTTILATRSTRPDGIPPARYHDVPTE